MLTPTAWFDHCSTSTGFPIDPFAPKGNSKSLNYGSVDLVKGYTKASVIAFVLMVVSELDLDSEWQKVLPFCDFLDRAFLLPCHVLELYQVYFVVFLLLEVRENNPVIKTPYCCLKDWTLEHLRLCWTEMNLRNPFWTFNCHSVVRNGKPHRYWVWQLLSPTSWRKKTEMESTMVTWTLNSV